MGIDEALEQVLTDEDRQIRQQFEEVLAAAKYQPVTSSRPSFSDEPYELGRKADAVAAIDIFVETARYIYRNPKYSDLCEVYLGRSSYLVDTSPVSRELEAELEERGYRGISVEVRLERYNQMEYGYIIDSYYYLVARFSGASAKR